MNNLDLQMVKPKSVEYIHESNPVWDSLGPFNKKSTFRIENYGHLKMLFLKIKVTTNVDTTYASPSSPYLFQNVFLESNGMPFATLNTTYTLSRIDSLFGTGLYNKMIRSSTFQGTLNGTQTVTLPLFFYVIDNQNFDPSKYDNITLTCITKSNREKMGFGANPTILTVKLVSIYDQYPSGQAPNISLKDSYNILLEENDLDFLASEKTIKLNNQSKVKSLIFMARSSANAGTSFLISAVKLRYTNGTEELYENGTNFNLNDDNGTNDGKTFKITMNSFNKFNGNMNPVVATVYYQAGITGVLYLVYEYDSVIIDSNRTLTEVFEESLY